MRLRPSLLLLSAAASAASPSLADVRYEWSPRKGADYYQGVLGTGDDALRVRTSHSWVMLPPDSTLRLEAYGPFGQPLGPVEVRPVQGPAAGAGGDRSGASAELAAAKKKKAPAPKPKPAKEEEDIDLAAEAAAPVVKETEKEVVGEAPEKPTPSLAHVSLSLGVGKEKLTATGGASHYDGSANVGGVVVGADYRPSASGWLLDGSVEAHTYETTTSVTPAGGGAAQEVDSKFTQLRLTAGAYYDFTATRTGVERAPLTAAVGLGLLHAQLPALKVSDPATGAATLANVAATRPYLGAILAYRTSKQSEIGGRVEDVPVAFATSPKLTSLEVEAYWRYVLSHKLYTLLGAAYWRDTASLSVTCPDVANCQTGSTATGTVMQARMGLGAWW